MKFFDDNGIEGNVLASILGSLMYFGTIVGVTIVSTLKDFGMHRDRRSLLLSRRLSACRVFWPWLRLSGRKSRRISRPCDIIQCTEWVYLWCDFLIY